jgi:hypothetical protein
MGIDYLVMFPASTRHFFPKTHFAEFGNSLFHPFVGIDGF